MLPTPTILLVGAVALVLLTVITAVSTGSFLAVLVVLALAGIVVYVLNQLGYLNVTSKDSTLDIQWHESAPAPASAKAIPVMKTLEEKEVFYVSGNDYTYDEAAAVCAAYDGELASYDQITDAYAKGAEWCGYGWTQGGMALYPTQESTWKDLQGETDETKRTQCGRPGVNGGYFDPSNKFGVNCFGVKPKGPAGMKFPTPLPGTDSGSFNRMVDKFKSMLRTMTVSPFNRDGWSEWSLAAHGGSQLAADVSKIKKAV